MNVLKHFNITPAEFVLAVHVFCIEQTFVLYTTCNMHFAKI